MKPSRSLWIRSPRTSDSAVPAAGPRPRVSLGACPEFGFSEAVWPHHDQLDQFMHLSKHRHLNNNKVSLTRCLALYTLAYFLCQLQQSFKLKLSYLHLATSEMWCWSGGRGILKKNCLCATVMCTIVMVHKSTSSSYKSVDCIKLWSWLV